jgi:hypothetical protein
MSFTVEGGNKIGSGAFGAVFVGRQYAYDFFYFYNNSLPLPAEVQKPLCPCQE